MIFKLITYKYNKLIRHLQDFRSAGLLPTATCMLRKGLRERHCPCMDGDGAETRSWHTTEPLMQYARLWPVIIFL